MHLKEAFPNFGEKGDSLQAWEAFFQISYAYSPQDSIKPLLNDLSEILILIIH